jgi:hypothetical protein
MFGLPRILIVYAIATPLALMIGYALSTGLSSSADEENLLIVVATVFFLMLPIFFKWHHILMICSWNAALYIPFVPGGLPFWLLLGALSFGISWLNGLLTDSRFLRVPELTRPLIFLGIAVFMTGLLRGGVGLSAFRSSSYGARHYIFIFVAIIGYFAFSAVRIPLEKAQRVAALYVLSATTSLLGNIIFMLGPAFYFLYMLTPIDYRSAELLSSPVGIAGLERFSSVSTVCAALLGYFLLRWGIRGTFSYAHPWRGVLFVATLLLSLLGGFRTVEIMIAILLIVQFSLERLWLTHFTPMLLAFAVALGLVFFATSEHLPLSAQRALSFLPVKVDPSVEYDAEGSAEWRFEMWRVLIPQIPRYFFLGKGFSIDPNEMYFATIGGGAEDIQAQAEVVAGDYHSGPLSVIIPLGIWGVAGFLWLLGAGVHVLYRNFRYGDPALRNINAYFLAYFLMQSIVFFLIFGALKNQLYLFTGLLGMSVSLNGGAAKPPPVVARAAGVAIVARNQSPVSVRV